MTLRQALTWREALVPEPAPGKRRDDDGERESVVRGGKSRGIEIHTAADLDAALEAARRGLLVI